MPSYSRFRHSHNGPESVEIQIPPCWQGSCRSQASVMLLRNPCSGDTSEARKRKEKSGKIYKTRWEQKCHEKENSSMAGNKKFFRRLYLPPFCFYTLERRNMKNRNPFSSADFKCFTQIVFVFRLSLSRPQSVRLLIGNTFCLCFCIFYGSSNKESLTSVLS